MHFAVERKNSCIFQVSLCPAIDYIPKEDPQPQDSSAFGLNYDESKECSRCNVTKNTKRF